MRALDAKGRNIETPDKRICLRKKDDQGFIVVLINGHEFSDSRVQFFKIRYQGGSKTCFCDSLVRKKGPGVHANDSELIRVHASITSVSV